MKKFITVFIALFTVMCCQTALAKIDLYKMSYTCFSMKGKERWKAQTEIVLTLKDIVGIYTLIEKGTGIQSGFKGKISWQTNFEFEEKKGTIRPRKLEKLTFKAGKVILKEYEDYKYSKGGNSVICRSEDLITGRKKEESFSFKGDIVNRLLLAIYIQKFLKKDENVKFTYMLSAGPRLYRMKIKVVSKEKITINGKEREACKVCLDPQLGLLNVLKTFLPRIYVWHSAKPHYEWLQYVGPESTVASPEVRMVTGN